MSVSPIQGHPTDTAVGEDFGVKGQGEILTSAQVLHDPVYLYELTSIMEESTRGYKAVQLSIRPSQRPISLLVDAGQCPDRFTLGEVSKGSLTEQLQIADFLAYLQL